MQKLNTIFIPKLIGIAAFGLANGAVAQEREKQADEIEAPAEEEEPKSLGSGPINGIHTGAAM